MSKYKQFIGHKMKRPQAVDSLLTYVRDLEFQYDRLFRLLNECDREREQLEARLEIVLKSREDNE